MELILQYAEQILIGIFVAINLLSFFIMVNDKRKAVRKNSANRTPEGFIFFMAAIFGAIGVYIGMLLIRHKTKRWYFQIGIPLLILQNLATLYVLNEAVRLFYR